MKSFCKALVVALSLVLVAPACAVGMSPSLPQVVRQRNDKDCLIAAMAMLGEWSYDEVDQTRRALEIPFVDGGLPVRDGLRIMAALGKPGAYLVAPNLATVPSPRGILVVQTPGQFSAHAVLISRGMILDPSLPLSQFWVLWFRAQPLAQVLGIVVLR